ncbi:MAG: MbtH family NRPS accessory protein [Leptolyngbya sp. SIO4C5]|nr:MbtH family NRPS accessory protein [Leptolyngbya sp. SIO4C5]
MNYDSEDTTLYKVVINHEEQYSIWPAHRDNPPGWRDGGKSGLKQDCLDYIKTVWTDMRPLSLRQQIGSKHDPNSSPALSTGTVGSTQPDAAE